MQQGLLQHLARFCFGKLWVFPLIVGLLHEQMQFWTDGAIGNDAVTSNLPLLLGPLACASIEIFTNFGQLARRQWILLGILRVLELNENMSVRQSQAEQIDQDHGILIVSLM